jgi:hypothetical protein
MFAAPARPPGSARSEENLPMREQVFLFAVSVFSPPGIFGFLLALVVRLVLFSNAIVDWAVGILLNLAAIWFWLSWFLRPSINPTTVTNSELGAVLLLYIGIGGLGVGWIAGILIRRVAVRS